MNIYTPDPANAASPAASAPAASAAPAYAPPAAQYPKLEPAGPTAPSPMYMPPMYQYPNPAYMNAQSPYQRPDIATVTTPAPMVAPGYVPAAYQPVAHPQPTAPRVQAEASKIRDWLAWSIVSLFFGALLLGFLPLLFSILCRRRKKRNELSGARTMSSLALVFNILNTVMVVIAIIGVVVYLLVFSQVMKKNEYY